MHAAAAYSDQATSDERAGTVTTDKRKPLKHWPDSLGATVAFFGLMVVVAPVASAAACVGAYVGAAWLFTDAWPVLWDATPPAWVLVILEYGLAGVWGFTVLGAWGVWYDETVRVWLSNRRFDRSIQRDFGITAEEYWDRTRQGTPST